MTAAALKAKPLPNYTKTEELMNTISHAIGIALGFVALITCLIASKDYVNITGSIIYGISMILMYSVSSLYHGMSAESMLQKQIMRIVDHCMIFIFIAGSYAPCDSQCNIQSFTRKRNINALVDMGGGNRRNSVQHD